MNKSSLKQDKLNTIPYDTIPKVLLLGNGINLPFGADSWGKIVNDNLLTNPNNIKKESIQGMSLPMQIVVATDNHVSQAMQKISNDFKKDKISYTQRDFLKELLDLPLASILTTNYSLELEQAALDNFSASNVRKLKKTTLTGTSQQEQFKMFQCYELPIKNNPYLWHIHGNAFYKNSVIMGHYYYGKLLSEINMYIPNLIRRYYGCMRYQEKYTPLSWIDYFILGEVHIVGFGMSLSEIDLWWLICCKQRHFKNRKTYFYNPEGKHSHKNILMENYGVTVVTDIPFDGDYIEYYRNVFERIKNV